MTSLKKGAVLLIAFLTTVSVSSQSLYKVNGKVSAPDSRAIAGAIVQVLNRNTAAISDSSGRFSFQLPAGEYLLKVSSEGFAASSKTIQLVADAETSFFLEPDFNQLDAVFVTVQKRDENLHDVPISVTALSARKVREYRLWSNQQLRGIVPNLYTSNPGDNRNVTSIRGITTTSYDPAVATYVDGVNQFSLDTYIADLLDVERIEILRGPQGTLYGRNAMGGVINVITKQPSNKTEGFAEVNIGNFNQQRYTAGIRLPIVSNKLYAGIAGLYNSRDGYFTNINNNSNFDRQHALTGNYFLKYLPSQSWTVTLNVKHHNNRNNGPFTLINGIDEALKNPFLINQNATTKMIDNVFNTSLSVVHAGDKLNFASQTAYQSNHRYYQAPIDGDFSPIDGVTIINNYGNDWNNTKVLTQEVRLSNAANNSRKISWTAGAYGFIQDNPVKQATRFGKDADLLGSPDINFSLINTAKGKAYGIAGFGQLEFALTERLSVVGGLRFDYENKEQSIRGQYQKDPNPDPVFDTQPDTSASVSFNAWSPKVGLSYVLSSSSRSYATFSRGFRTGGLTSLGSDPSQPPLYAFRPEYSNNIEVGLKNSFMNNKFRADISVFYITVKDAQVPTLVLPQAITITQNAGKMESKGVELELATTIINGLEIDYNFGYTSAEYKTLKVPVNGTEVNLAGKKQIYTPIITSGLAAQYTVGLNRRQTTRLVARGEWYYFGKQYFDLRNEISQNAYQLFNARAGVAFSRIELMFWARNLTDTRYVDFAYDFGAVHLGDPQSYGLSVRARF